MEISYRKTGFLLALVILIATASNAYASDDISTQVEIPDVLAAGTYHFGAIVTVDSGPSESNEDNNTKVASTTLEVTD